jgi:hypothetical protein
MYISRAFAAVLVVAGTFGSAALAAAAGTFTGPTGWSHIGSPAPDPARTFEQWRLAGPPDEPAQTVTFIADTTVSYADALAMIKKNFADNNIKPKVDTDATCQGRQGHVVEFLIGPEGKAVITNRLLVPDGAGVVTITYVRGQTDNYDDDVKKAVTAYCKPS